MSEMTEVASDRSEQGAARAAFRLQGLAVGLLVAGCAMASPYGAPESIPQLWWGLAAMGLGYAVSWWLRAVSGVWFWGGVIATRLLLLPMFPGDDVWRYLWEGYIQTLGFSPYHLPPNATELIPYRTDWWSLINFPDVTAIYPPLTQIGFRGLAMIVPAVLLFKLAFVAADLVTCGLLSRRFGYGRAIIYAWNPVILYSFAGGAHYDSWFVLPLVAAWLAMDYPAASVQWQRLRSAVCLGLSVAVKWISLPILAFMAWQTVRQQDLKLAVGVLLCGSLPMVAGALAYCRGTDCPLVPVQSGFVLYGRSAEFIPRFFSALGEPLSNRTWPYAIPVAISLLILLVTARSFAQFAEPYLGVLMICSPIVHLWYFTWLVPFAVASGNWGTRFLSLSAFVYFVLPYRQSLGDTTWLLSWPERLMLWLPFLLGWLWTIRRSWQARTHA